MSKFLRKLYEAFIVLLHPSFWLQDYYDYKYSESFDTWCRESLKKGFYPEVINNYCVAFNGRKLWIANGKYCCFHLYEPNLPNVNQSRYVKIKMWKKLRNDSWKIKE